MSAELDTLRDRFLSAKEQYGWTIQIMQRLTSSDRHKPSNSSLQKRVGVDVGKCYSDENAASPQWSTAQPLVKRTQESHTASFTADVASPFHARNNASAHEEIIDVPHIRSSSPQTEASMPASPTADDSSMTKACQSSAPHPEKIATTPNIKLEFESVRCGDVSRAHTPPSSVDYAAFLDDSVDIPTCAATYTYSPQSHNIDGAVNDTNCINTEAWSSHSTSEHGRAPAGSPSTDTSVSNEQIHFSHSKRTYVCTPRNSTASCCSGRTTSSTQQRRALLPPSPNEEKESAHVGAVEEEEEDFPIVKSTRKAWRPTTATAPATTMPPVSMLHYSDSEDDIPLTALRRAKPSRVSMTAKSNIELVATKKQSTGARKSFGFRSKYIDDAASCSESDDEEAAADANDNEYDYDDGFLVAEDEEASDAGAEAEENDATDTDGSSISSHGSSVEEDGYESPAVDTGRSKASCVTSATKTYKSSFVDGVVHPKTGRIVITEEHSNEPVAVHKRTRDKLSEALYSEYNREVFSGLLPETMELIWAPRLTKTAGQTIMSRRAVDGVVKYTAKITLSTKVLDTTFKLAKTLLHEMCHAAAWIIDHNSNPPHGDVFKKWGRIATKSYPKREVTVCHSYDIQYKFHYVCTLCGYLVGRHSKSIDIKNTRCNFRGCGGVFSVRTGDGKAVDVSTPKPLSDYQRFMQQQRSAVKATKPWMTPQEIMKEVGQRWAVSKTKLAATTADDLIELDDDDNDGEATDDASAAPVESLADRFGSVLEIE